MKSHHQRRLWMSALTLAVSQMFCAMTWAQTSADHNAATWYQQAIAQYNQFKATNAADLELLWNYSGDLSEPITPEMRSALARVQPIIDLAHRAAAQEYCDFGLDRSQGFDLMLPHLQPMRGIAKLMNFDVRVHLMDGDSMGAAERVADMYRMSGQFAEDQVIISSMVGQAVFTLVDKAAQYAIDRGAFGDAESQAILQSISQFDSKDPFSYLEAVSGEQELTVGWLENKLSDPESREKINEEMGMFGGDDQTRMQLMLMDDNAIHGAIADYDSVMNRVTEIFANPDSEAAKQQMKELEAEIEQHQHGPLTQMSLPAFGKILDRRDDAVKMLANRIAILRRLAKGEVKPDELANAAIWYVRGAEMLEKLDPAQLKMVRDFISDASQPMNPEFIDALKSKPCQDVIDIFREASQKRRCDFSFTRNSNVDFVPGYGPGMHDAAKLLQADAVRQLRSGDEGAGVDRLAICLRMAGHLGGDTEVVSPLIAHHDFNSAIALMQTLFASGTLKAESKPALADALERVSMKDPFGYVGAVIATREEVGKFISGYFYRPIRSDDDQKKVQDIRADAKTLDGDQLLFLVAVTDTMQRNEAQRKGESQQPAGPAADSAPAAQPDQAHEIDAASPHVLPQPEPIMRLADVISISNLGVAQQLIPQVAPLLAQGNLDFLHEGLLPALAHSGGGESFADCFRRARSDLRRAYLLLQLRHVKQPETEPATPAER